MGDLQDQANMIHFRENLRLSSAAAFSNRLWLYDLQQSISAAKSCDRSPSGLHLERFRCVHQPPVSRNTLTCIHQTKYPPVFKHALKLTLATVTFLALHFCSIAQAAVNPRYGNNSVTYRDIRSTEQAMTFELARTYNSRSGEAAGLA